MCLLIETIKIIDGQLQNIAFHNFRLNKARKELFSCSEDMDIAKAIKIPVNDLKGVYKCTVTYNADIIETRFQSYTIRKIKSLKLVTDNSIEYSYKYAKRDSLNKLLAQQGECDEILIVKNGFVTDTSFSNIIFYNGKEWVTPNYPLLKGTKREKLLQQGLIKEEEIKVTNLVKFPKACLINAMLEVEDIVIDVKDIK